MLKTILNCLFVLFLLVCCKKPEEIYYNPVITYPVIPVDTSNNTSPDTSIVRHYLALGDSYTIGQSVPESERFPVQVVRMLDSMHLKFTEAEIIARTGWTTGDLLFRLSSNPPAKDLYDVVTVLIGVNNQYQHRTRSEYTAEFALVLQKAIDYAGGKKNHVFVLSIPDWGATPFGGGGSNPEIGPDIDAFNAINKQISLEYGVNYLDITGYTRLASTDPSLTTTDGLHPSGKEYAVWVSRLVPMIRSVL